MVFKPNARLNPRQVLDRRGVGGAGGIALGGGGIGVILLLAYVLLGGDPGALSGVANPGFVTDQNGNELTEECQTGQDANERAGLPHRRLRQQHPGLLDRRVRPEWFHLPDRPTPCSSTAG